MIPDNIKFEIVKPPLPPFEIVEVTDDGTQLVTRKLLSIRDIPVLIDELSRKAIAKQMEQP